MPPRMITRAGDPPGPRVVLVAGNGDRMFHQGLTADVTVAFNETQIQDPASTLVSASTAQEPIDRQHTLVLLSDAADLRCWLDYLQDSAHEDVSEQMERLGCHPSTGFMVIHALWALHTRVWVDGIGFDPPLVRPTHLPLRKPLPQMFHNWLGERRVSLLRWLSDPPSDWTWPLTTGPTCTGYEPSTDVAAVAHSDVLEALLAAQQSRSLSRLTQLAQCKVQSSDSLLHESSITRQLEGCFHLQREVSETANWWLFDHQASSVVNRLAARLRSAQRQSFLLMRQRAGVVG